MEILDTFNHPMPVIGDYAPDFEAVTTVGSIKFSDYAPGKWILLFSHPADFTPVCTTEMSGFAQRQAEFEALNTALIGLSIDSIHSHLAWVNNSHSRFEAYKSILINRIAFWRQKLVTDATKLRQIK